MKSIVFFCFCNLILISSVYAVSNRFSISISGINADIKFFKAQSEIKTIKSKKFCTQKFFPVRDGKWSCLA